MPDLDDYVDVRELHPACVKLPCRYEHCDAERWVCGSGSTRGYTVCPDCGPDIDHLTTGATVRL
ncbi:MULTISPECIES: hypothetical protein [unclassified Haloarcula]|uniref:hypothetical protein n=1 Tax=unclassified Haloarcula TaxID=2624677 RepID=UPI00073E6D93|nr:MULTISPECIES: hypothetical protein [unclassified Haloarcula]